MCDRLSLMLCEVVLTVMVVVVGRFRRSSDDLDEARSLIIILGMQTLLDLFTLLNLSINDHIVFNGEHYGLRAMRTFNNGLLHLPMLLEMD